MHGHLSRTTWAKTGLEGAYKDIPSMDDILLSGVINFLSMGDIPLFFGMENRLWAGPRGKEAREGGGWYIHTGVWRKLLREMGESHSLQCQVSLRQSSLFSSKRELAITGIFAARQNNPSKQTMTSHTGFCSLEINVKDGEAQN